MSAHQQYPPLKYGSVCSGIEAATVAWHPLGMEPVWFAEIETFPSAVLAHHYPDTPNLGDMTKLAALVLSGKVAAPDVLVGGTPCQAFSVAGMRQGMLDPRGALTIKYVELADAVDHVRTSRNEPESIIVWENVPGVLSDKGNAFGCFLGALAGEDCELQPPGKRWQDAGCVYGPKRTIAWRILDAQYFGLAQRRRRVFVVASARAGFDPLEVLFEREGVRRDTAPRRGEGQDVTGTAPFGPALQCGCGHVFSDELGHYGCPNCEGDEGPAVTMFGGIPAFGGHSLSGSIERSATLTAKDTRLDMESETFLVQASHEVTGTLSARTSGGGGLGNDFDLAGGRQVAGTLTSHAFSGGAGGRPEGAACVTGDVTHAIQAGALRTNPRSGPDGVGVQADHAYTLEARAEVQAVQSESSVRRLTPVECERLQGFPDDYTLICCRGRPLGLCPDGPRYKAIGNSKAVPVVRWIGSRIQQQI